MTGLFNEGMGTAAWRGMGAVLLLGLLAGCHHRHHLKPLPAPPTAAPTPVPQPPPVPQSYEQRYAAAVTLLDEGEAARARALVAPLVTERPYDRHARQLLREIDTDSHALYGNNSFPYVVQPGDTLVSLAHRFLHDAANFYGLGRYNKLSFPVELRPGQSLQIPGRTPKPRPAAVSPRRPTAAPATAAPKPKEAPRPPVTAAQRARAQQLRQQGLEQMSAGSIDRAARLLSQAAILDPNSSAIAGELARARRIQATVHSR